MIATFVDTNILMYGMDELDTDKHSVAVHWIEHLWASRSGRVSVQVLNELYVVLTRKMKPPVSARYAWKQVKNLFAWQPVTLTTECVETAHTLSGKYHLSWWDALIVSAAIQARCKNLLTEDLQDGMKIGDLKIINPFLHPELMPLS